MKEKEKRANTEDKSFAGVQPSNQQPYSAQREGD